MQVIPHCNHTAHEHDDPCNCYYSTTSINTTNVTHIMSLPLAAASSSITTHHTHPLSQSIAHVILPLALRLLPQLVVWLPSIET
jgi:hypothetical protein